MPRKMARSGCQTRFGLAEALMAVHTLYLSCGKAGKAPILAPVRESSGESRLIISDEAQERLTNLWPSRYVWEGIGLSPATNESTINSQDDGSEPSDGGACRVRPHG